MAPRCRTVTRAVLFVAALARAVAAGEPSCGQGEACAPEDVEAMEEASMDALRVELLQSGGRLLPAGGSAQRAVPEGGLGLTGEPAERSGGPPELGAAPPVCTDAMTQCGCPDWELPSHAEDPAVSSDEFDRRFKVFKYICHGNSACWAYEMNEVQGDFPSELCPAPGKLMTHNFTVEGKGCVARTCCFAGNSR